MEGVFFGKKKVVKMTYGCLCVTRNKQKDLISFWLTLWITPHTVSGMLPRSFPWTSMLSSSLLVTLVCGDYSVSTWTTKYFTSMVSWATTWTCLRVFFRGYVVSSSKECLQTCVALTTCTSWRANTGGVQRTIISSGVRTYYICMYERLIFLST